VKASFDESIFTFAKVLLELVEIMQVCVSNSLLNFVNPLISFFFGLKIINSPLVWKDKHEWEHHRSVVHELFLLTFDEYSSKRLHVFVLLVTLVFIAVQFFAEHDVPVLAILSSFLLLLDDLPFDVDGVFAFTLVAGFLIKSHWKATDTMGDSSSTI